MHNVYGRKTFPKLIMPPILPHSHPNVAKCIETNFWFQIHDMSASESEAEVEPVVKTVIKQEPSSPKHREKEKHKNSQGSSSKDRKHT